MHRVAAIGAIALAAAVVYGLRRVRPRLALVLVFAMALLTGVASVSARPSLTFVVLHSASAAALAAALAMAVIKSRRAGTGAYDRAGTAIAFVRS